MSRSGFEPETYDSRAVAEQHGWPSRQATRRPQQVDDTLAVVEERPTDPLYMPEDEVRRSFAALERTGYLEAIHIDQMDAWAVKDVTEKAYRVAGLHPDGENLTERLASLLEQAASNTEDPEERSKLSELPRQVVDDGGQALAGVLAALIVRGLS